MITNLYAVKVGKSFWAPTTYSKDNEAILLFGAAVNDPATMLGQLYGEASLYKIGTYNVLLGKVKAIKPVLIKKGVDIKLPEKQTDKEFQKEVEDFSEKVLNGN